MNFLSLLWNNYMFQVMRKLRLLFDMLISLNPLVLKMRESMSLSWIYVKATRDKRFNFTAFVSFIPLYLLAIQCCVACISNSIAAVNWGSKMLLVLFLRCILLSGRLVYGMMGKLWLASRMRPQTCFAWLFHLNRNISNW